MLYIFFSLFSSVYTIFVLFLSLCMFLLVWSCRWRAVRGWTRASERGGKIAIWPSSSAYSILSHQHHVNSLYFFVVSHKLDGITTKDFPSFFYPSLGTPAIIILLGRNSLMLYLKMVMVIIFEILNMTLFILLYLF